MKSLKDISFPSKTSKHRTYLHERVSPYLPLINWQNETLEKDKRKFWIAVYKHEKTHPSGSLERILEWAKDKNLYPGQIVKALLNNKKKTI